jgi:trehalose synthase
MTLVSPVSRSISDYIPLIGEKPVDEARSLAEELEERSVIHVNSTSYGGGVAEILHRLVPLMQDVGLPTSWKVICGSSDFFNVTKQFHNALQGEKIKLTDKIKEIYLNSVKENAENLKLDHDFTIIHDTQPLAIIKYSVKVKGKWIWRCHIDLSQPNREFLDFISPLISLYDVSIFSMKQYIKESLKSGKTSIIAPSIDPLSEKNKPLTYTQIHSILEKFDIDSERPIITQVARFDPWKDPLGVIDVYKQIRREIPGLQLLLIGSMACDDPEGWVYYEKTARHAGEDYNIHLLTDLVGVHDLEVNAFQRSSDVILAKSIREGFGLTVTEALWKGIPVVGGNVGGIPLQIQDGVSGFLVNTIEDAVKKTAYLLKNPQMVHEMGKQGREHVFKNFLITRHLIDYLKLFKQLSET